jgi:hypothetical protein
MSDAGPDREVDMGPPRPPCQLELLDDDFDEVVDRSVVREFDEYDFKTREGVDLRADGVVDEMTLWAYRREDGEVVRMEISSGTPQPELRSVTVFYYDMRGNRIESWRDDNLDDRVDRLRLFTYDARDRLVREERDVLGDGVTDWRTEWIYEGDGESPVREEQDRDADGTVDQIATWERDEDGNATREERDHDADGTADVVWERTYDADGNLTSEARDDDVDGTPDWRTDFSYDDDGNRVREEWDLEADGTPDWIVEATYDEDGHPLVVERDDEVDGTIDWRRTRTYDDVGRLVREELDSDGDDTPESVTTWRYEGCASWPTLE